MVYSDTFSHVFAGSFTQTTCDDLGTTEAQLQSRYWPPAVKSVFLQSYI